MVARRRRVVVAALVAAVLVVAAVFVVRAVTSHALTPAERAAAAARAEQIRLRRLLAPQTKAADQVKGALTVVLPTRRGAPAPTPPATLFKVPLPSHEVVGFVPDSLVASLDQADYADTSELVYSSVCIAPSGALDTTSAQCARPFTDLRGASFASLVTTAHASGDRVLVSFSDFDQHSIAALVEHPQQSAARLSAAVAPLVGVGHLDGIDLDVEGTSASERAGYVAFVTAFAHDYRLADPGGALMLDAYAGAASGSPNFYDVAKLARIADAIFVEAYDMDSASVASASSPLQSPVLGYSVVQTLMQYERVVPADKIILGVPFYGNDFSTVSARPGARASTAAPEAFPDQAITKAGYPPLWDPASDTPYSVLRRAGAWHQIWFDDPVSIALKAALASQFHTLGVGAWALGMEGGDSEMLAALGGGSPPLRSGAAAG